jgi:hypothetical protein
VFPSPVGPTSGPVSGTADLTSVVHTQAFDTSAVASTGDAWLFSIHPNTPFSPLVLQPGQSGTITVTITPTGAKGAVHSGVLYVDALASNQFLLSGDELIAFPYTYTIG